jgi:zinc transport system substrate-binding protein
MTGIAPYTYLAERIGGDNVRIGTLIKQSQDPHTFEPSPKQILSIGSARIFFLAGLDFEKHLSAKIQNSFPGLAFVDLSAGLVSEEEIDADEGGTEHHGDQDQHLWLSPKILKIQAERMAEAFSREDKKHTDVYYANLHAFQEELDRLTARIARQLQPFRGRTFFVFHPAFASFAEEFGLHQKAVETNNRMSSPKQIAALIDAAGKEGVKIIFVQPQFDQTSAKTIASSIGGAVVALDPLAKDVLNNFSVIADKLEGAFQ